MSSEVGTITTRNSCPEHQPEPATKVVFSGRLLLRNADRPAVGRRPDAYLLDAEDPESVRCLGHGRHQVRGGRHLVAIDSADRLFLAPDYDCVLDYSARAVDLIDTVPGADTVTVGVMKMPRPAIVTGPETEALFHTVSSICTQPGKHRLTGATPFSAAILLTSACRRKAPACRQCRRAIRSICGSLRICDISMRPPLWPSTWAHRLRPATGRPLKFPADRWTCHRTTGISSAGRERCSAAHSRRTVPCAARQRRAAGSRASTCRRSPAIPRRS